MNDDSPSPSEETGAEEPEDGFVLAGGLLATDNGDGTANVTGCGTTLRKAPLTTGPTGEPMLTLPPNYT